MLELGVPRPVLALVARAVRRSAAGQRTRSRGSSICSLALDRQLTHIEQNLSHYFSPNTHLSGEALALYVAGCALPELDGQRPARRARPRRPDPGGDAADARRRRARRAVGALSPLLDRLLPARGARRAARRAIRPPPVFEEAARPQAATCARSATTAASGRSSATTTAGSCFRSAGGRSEDCRPTLAHRRRAARRAGAARSARCRRKPAGCAAPRRARACRSRRTHWPSTALTASGYYVSRTDARRSSGVRRRSARFPQRRPRARRRAVAHADRRRPAAADRSGHRHLHDGRGAARSVSQLDRCTTPSCSTAARSPSRAAPFSGSPRTTADAPIWRQCERWRLRRRHARRLCAASPHPRRSWRCTVSAGGFSTTSSARRRRGVRHRTGTSTRRGVSRATEAHVCRLAQHDVTLALASTAPLTVLAPGETPLACRSPAYGVARACPGRPWIARADRAGHRRDLHRRRRRDVGRR